MRQLTVATVETAKEVTALVPVSAAKPETTNGVRNHIQVLFECAPATGIQADEIPALARTPGSGPVDVPKVHFGKIHRAPLCMAAHVLLSDKPVLASDVVKAGQLIPDMSTTTVLRRMEQNDIDLLCLCSPLRGWTGETASFRQKVFELALARGMWVEAEGA
ncbi:MAG: hypothetical protein AAGI36_06225 [Pseudomonadota bacterium]